ncbi:hypothetical protein JKY72_03725 [Candidatus Gracilibacteria bacterium]|nr:hypothetical protein [Candidatus Gracilibacteria bacterium]
MKNIFIKSFLIMLATTACTSPAPLDDDPIGTHLDNQAFSEALGDGDEKKCERIEDETMKEECENAIQDLALSTDALNSMDKGLCSGISDERIQEGCELNIAEAVADTKAAEEQQKKNDADLALDFQAVEKGSLAACDKIEDPAFKESCRYNVTVDMVAEGGKLKLCEIFEDSVVVERCKSSQEEGE